MSLELVRYDQGWESRWDSFCEEAPNSTMLHTRRFLGYHRDRFSDESLVLLQQGRIVGLLPAASTQSDGLTVISHPGATYGGFVHHGALAGGQMIEAFQSVCAHYLAMGAKTIVYKPVPYIYTRGSAQDDLYGLFRLGAVRVRCDLSCAIDLSFRGRVSERRRRALKKANRAVLVSSDIGLLPDLWTVLHDNLLRKHGATAVHTFDELRDLIERFPEKILLRAAIVAGRVEAGVIFFVSTCVWHAQYIAASETGYQCSALDAVFESAIAEASISARYFDFGTSNEERGLVLNDGLYRFKSEFGGGGAVHEFYEIRLATLSESLAV